MDEDALISITEISCPMGIRTWASLRHKSPLPASCVGGEDECEIVEELIQLPTISEPPSEETNIGGNEGSNKEQQIRKVPGLPVEYSPKRHREGIEMGLTVLEGLNITLNTPCKLWIFFAVAHFFNVPTVPVIGNLISTWFFTSTNTEFIEIRPDVTYRVACGIKCSWLCQIAYEVLVGDEALLYLIRRGGLRPVESWKDEFTHSRLSDNLGDNEVQRIEYASKRFADDIIGHFLHLAGKEMAWLNGIREHQKLDRHVAENPEDRDWVVQLKCLIRTYVRYMIYNALRDAKDPRRTRGAVPLATEDPDRSFSMFEKRDIVQRILGRSFWVQLLNLRLDSVSYPPAEAHDSIAELASGLLAFQGQIDARIERMHESQLAEKIGNFNILAKRTSEDRIFELEGFYDEIGSYLCRYTETLIKPSPERKIVLDVTETLTCLGDNQYRFLPLWAGGNDDETGGVFADQNIPMAETGGFCAPGPVMHTGSSASRDDSFSMIDANQSTIQAASHHATLSHVSDLLSVDSTDVTSVELVAVAPVERDSGIPLAGHEGASAEDELDLDTVE